MAFAHCFLTLPTHTSNFTRPFLSSYTNSFSSPNLNTRTLSNFPKNLSIAHKASVKAQASEASAAADAFTNFKHVLLPITDRNPYLSEGSRQAAATAAAMAKKYGADITVVVIDEKEKEAYPEHETQLASIRWHLSEGGYQEFKLLERLGEGSKPTAIIGEVADDMNLDMVIMSMEAIHSKHVDANLLAEFIPCPVLLLPL
ncbi:hypothetical protein P3S67_025330 [Capsicum chacoense]|uniref:UspA domain-containing protein n=1 Tax=Capsicum annuum TaxID=4072 RepID=A0A1U8FXL9_CAPAN|nr:uncharacterized protein LOC107859846 [Capsicum annuum]KAF3678856.1 putative peroxidase 64-like [Capsicum annuum]PHT91002.1 hypothetical protein T459_06115 [Capsicum annuum]